MNEDLFQTSDSGDLTRYANDPIGFARDILGIRLWRAQREVLESLVTHPRVSVRSAHGIGKSFLSAVAILWGVLTHKDSIIVTTAPVWDQVEEIIWSEIHSLVQKAKFKLPGELLKTEYRLGPKWKAFGRSTNKPERFSGIHATPIHSADWDLSEEEFWAKLPEQVKDSSFMMIVIDEASGVEESIYEAAAGFMTTRGSIMLLIGNPTQPMGTFFKSHQPLRIEDYGGNEEIRKAIEWKTFHVSAFDVIKEAPRLYDPNYIERARYDWGEGSPMWQVRVLGEFPTEGEDILFPLHYLERIRRVDFDSQGNILKGMERDKDGKLTAQKEAGIDIGGQGTGETVCYVRRGQFVDGFYSWREPDTTITARKIAEIIVNENLKVVRIDRGSFGKSVIDMLNKMRGINCAIIPVDFGGGPHDPKNYGCRRDEMFFEVAQMVRRREISGLKDDTTIAQLSDIKYAPNRRDKIIVESKEQMEKRGRKSPDRADAFVLCFCNPIPKGRNFQLPDNNDNNKLKSVRPSSVTGITLNRENLW